MREISSLQHPLVKHLVKLRESREYRYETSRVVISGLKLIQELSSSRPFRTLILEEGFIPSFSCPAVEIYSVPTAVLKKITGLVNPEPIAAELDMPLTQDLSSLNYLLILDGISDPGNLGTLLRTALALGWEGAFLTPGSTDPFNEKAVRAAKGATFKLPVKSGSWQELTALLQEKKYTLYAADAKGKNFSECRISAPIALALGNEAHGLARELTAAAQLLAIPMSGPMESLNVASAGAILMYALRQS